MTKIFSYIRDVIRGGLLAKLARGPKIEALQEALAQYTLGFISANETLIKALKDNPPSNPAAPTASTEVWEQTVEDVEIHSLIATLKFDSLSKGVIEADSLRKLRTVNRELNKLSAEMRGMCFDSVRGYLQRFVAIWLEEQARKIRFKLTNTKLRILNRKIRLLKSTDRAIIGTICEEILKADELPSLSILSHSSLSHQILKFIKRGIHQYVIWTARYAGRFIKIYAIELIILLGLLWQGLGYAMGLIQARYFYLGMAVGTAVEILKEYFFNEWLDAFFFQRRRMALLWNVVDICSALVVTRVSLSDADVEWEAPFFREVVAEFDPTNAAKKERPKNYRSTA